MASPIWDLEVPAATPSLNVFTNRRNPFTYSALRSRWREYLTSAWFDARRLHPELAGFVPPPRACLTIYRYSPAAIDPDNLVGGVKPVLDALRSLALMADDNPSSLRLDVRPVRREGPGATRLVLEPWPPEPEPRSSCA